MVRRCDCLSTAPRLPARPGPVPSKLPRSHFAGLIDEVRVYNRALTASQIQTDLNTPVTRVVSNSPPAIALTSPADGASYAAPATINLAATVTTNAHTI